MKVVIVEDELAASENLTFLLQKINPEIQVIKVLDSVRTAVPYFRENTEASLIFMDIHLADGLSFEIFEQIKVNTPVIFTTAYDQYTLKAFKVNSIDYLLKPVDEDELRDALNQYKVQHENKKPVHETQIDSILEFIQTRTKTYKKTFLVNQRDQLIPLKTEEIAFAYIDTGNVKTTTFKNQTFILENTLEELEENLDPSQFFRVNRQYILSRNCIQNISQYFNGKLIVNVTPPSPERIVVSKAKASGFKSWLNT